MIPSLLSLIRTYYGQRSEIPCRVSRDFLRFSSQVIRSCSHLFPSADWFLTDCQLGGYIRRLQLLCSDGRVSPGSRHHQSAFCVRVFFWPVSIHFASLPSSTSYLTFSFESNHFDRISRRLCVLFPLPHFVFWGNVTESVQHKPSCTNWQTRSGCLMLVIKKRTITHWVLITLDLKTTWGNAAPGCEHKTVGFSCWGKNWNCVGIWLIVYRLRDWWLLVVTQLGWRINTIPVN